MNFDPFVLTKHVLIRGPILVLEKQKHNSQRFEVELRIALKFVTCTGHFAPPAAPAL